MKNNQNGFSHIIVIAAVALIIGVVGFAAFRVGQSNEAQNNQQKENVDNPKPKNQLSVEQKSDTVTVPSPEKTSEPVKETPPPTPAPKPAPVEQPKSKTNKTYLKISLISATQQGSVLNIHSKIERNVTGTCNFKLYKEGQPKIHTSNAINNASDCVGQLSLSSINDYQGWSVSTWFDGSDGLTYAYQQAVAAPISKP